MTTRVTLEEYERLDLRAHALLSDVPLHDVWAVDLRGGGSGRTVADVRALLSMDDMAAAGPAVRFLFRLRGWLGRVFGWDAEPAAGSTDSFASRLSADDRERSRVPTGTPAGPFRALFESAHESISEIRNSTVHAFSVFALVERPDGYRLYWGIHVRPVGRITAWYMAIIDPFRRFIIYPSVLRYLQSAWAHRVAGRSD
ncbi:MAG: DUF2867 domain-containing protein [Deltaproteobacteria bacterium]|nr:DUF2867 domain-containing protein [Deltaproteobacteria bacterium]